MKHTKVPVTERALIQRINRKLEPGLERLKMSRTEHMEQQIGRYWVLDLNRNFVRHPHVNLETYARELGVLREWEAVENEK
jgi:hypothetical protein